MKYLIIFFFLFFQSSNLLAKNFYLDECQGKTANGKSSPGVFSYIIDREKKIIMIHDHNAIYKTSDTYVKIISDVQHIFMPFVSNVFYFKGHEKISRQLRLNPFSGSGVEKVWNKGWGFVERETTYYIDCKQTNFHEVHMEIIKKRKAKPNEKFKLEKNKQNETSTNNEIVEKKENSFSFKNTLGKMLGK